MPRIRRIRRRKINKAAQAPAQLDAVKSPGSEDQAPGSTSRVVIVGDRIFNLKLSNLMGGETDFKIVATADTRRDAFAFPNEFAAELTVVDVDFDGHGQGIKLARELNEKSPGCAFMLICGPFTSTTVQTLWVYGADSWSVITQATAKSPAHFAEVVSSAVHGIPWIEPGITRALREYGPRPNSLDERKLLVFERDQSKAV